MSTLKVTNIESPSGGGVNAKITDINGGQLSNRNLIDNGDHRIDQRNDGSAVTGSGDFPVDRFNLSESGGGAFSAQRVADAPTGFQFSTKVTTTTADTSITGTERLLYITRLEGQNTAFLEFGTANAKTITLSFYVKSSITGTFSGSLQNGASNRSYPYNYTINTANTWEYKTVTITGDTTGTWATDNTKSHQVIWSLGNSSDRAATVNAWGDGQIWGSTTGTTNTLGTLNATWFITGVQLEVGEVATAFEHRSLGDELAKCQRYFQTSFASAPGTGNTDNTGIVLAGGSTTGNSTTFLGPGHIQLAPNMRAAPTVTVYDLATPRNTGKVHRHTYGSSGSNNNTAVVTDINTKSFIVRSDSGISASGIIFHYEVESEL